jgi:hypothetical protein
MGYVRVPDGPWALAGARVRGQAHGRAGACLEDCVSVIGMKWWDWEDGSAVGPLQRRSPSIRRRPTAWLICLESHNWEIFFLEGGTCWSMLW